MERLLTRFPEGDVLSVTQKLFSATETTVQQFFYARTKGGNWINNFRSFATAEDFVKGNIEPGLYSTECNEQETDWIEKYHIPNAKVIINN